MFKEMFDLKKSILRSCGFLILGLTIVYAWKHAGNEIYFASKLVGIRFEVFCHYLVIVKKAAFLLSALVFMPYVLNKTGSSQNILRGRSLTSYEKAKALAWKWFNKGRECFWFAGLPLPQDEAARHVLIVGNSGSGKSLLLNSMMGSTLPSGLQSRKDRAIVYDAKGDMVSTLAGMGLEGETVIINPLDARSRTWNVGADINTSVAATQLASCMIPQNSKSANPFFENTPRALISAAAQFLMKASPLNWSLRDLLLICNDSKYLMKALKESGASNHLLHFKNPETGSNLLSALQTHLEPYVSIAAAWSKCERKFTLREWMQGGSVLVLPGCESARDAMDSLNRVMFKRIVELLLSLEEYPEQKSWVFLDEVREAGRLSLGRLMTQGRSKGVRVFLGFQCIEGLQEVYGPNVGKEIIGQCGNKIILRVETEDTARWAQGLMGDQEIMEEQRTDSRSKWSLLGGGSKGNGSLSVSKHIVRRPVVLASELVSLPYPSKEKGVTGYAMAACIGAFKFSIPGKEMQAMLPPKGSVKDFVAAEKSSQIMTQFEEAEKERLGLEKIEKQKATIEKVIVGQAALETGSREILETKPKIGLKDVRRISLWGEEN